MLLKSKKEEMVKDLEKMIKDSNSLVFVNFHGLKVSDETKLRRELRAKEVNYKVGRKTLLAPRLPAKRKGKYRNIRRDSHCLLQRFHSFGSGNLQLSKNPQRALVHHRGNF